MRRSRRHSNTKGTRQIKRGKTADTLKRIAAKLKMPFRVGKQKDERQ
jgi:hypothetical protein